MMSLSPGATPRRGFHLGGLDRRSFFVVDFVMDIEVKFDGVEILVTKPGTDFMLAYQRGQNKGGPSKTLTVLIGRRTITCADRSDR